MTTYIRWARNEEGDLVRTGITYVSVDGGPPTWSTADQAVPPCIEINEFRDNTPPTRVFMDHGSNDKGWSVGADVPPSEQPPVTIESVMAKVVKQERTVFGGRMVVVCLTMQNGALVTGEVTCQDAEHFNAQEGFELALDRALEKALAFEIYVHRQKKFEYEQANPLPL